MVIRVPTPYSLFNSTISITKETPSLDAGNGPVETFTAYLTNIPANVQFSIGSELPNWNGAQRAKRYGVAKVAPDLGITTDMRLVFNGQTYNITAVRDPVQTGTLTRIDFESIV